MQAAGLKKILKCVSKIIARVALPGLGQAEEDMQDAISTKQQEMALRILRLVFQTKAAERMHITTAKCLLNWFDSTPDL